MLLLWFARAKNSCNNWNMSGNFSRLLEALPILFKKPHEINKRFFNLCYGQTLFNQLCFISFDVSDMFFLLTAQEFTDTLIFKFHLMSCSSEFCFGIFRQRRGNAPGELRRPPWQMAHQESLGMDSFRIHEDSTDIEGDSFKENYA